MKESINVAEQQIIKLNVLNCSNNITQLYLKIKEIVEDDDIENLKKLNLGISDINRLRFDYNMNFL